MRTGRASQRETPAVLTRHRRLLMSLLVAPPGREDLNRPGLALPLEGTQ